MKLYTNLTKPEVQVILEETRPEWFVAMGVERYVENNGTRYWLLTTVPVYDLEGNEF